MGGLQTDAELVSRALSGSDVAFSRLVERHQAAVRGFLRRMLGGGWAEADDVAQDTFLAAWQSLRSLKEPAGVRAWLCGIAWRKAQDRIRSSRRGAARGVLPVVDAGGGKTELRRADGADVAAGAAADDDDVELLGHGLFNEAVSFVRNEDPQQ